MILPDTNTFFAFWEEGDGRHGGGLAIKKPEGEMLSGSCVYRKILSEGANSF